MSHGEIHIGGERVNFRSPLDAIDLGIGMVHQHRKLVSAHSVRDAVADLGLPLHRMTTRLTSLDDVFLDKAAH